MSEDTVSPVAALIFRRSSNMIHSTTRIRYSLSSENFFENNTEKKKKKQQKKLVNFTS